MALPKLSERLYDAILSGDKDRIATLKAERDAKAPPSKRSAGWHIEQENDLEKNSTSAVAVDNILKKMLGDDWSTHDLDTIWKLVFHDSGIPLSTQMSDKVAAIKVVKNSLEPFNDWFAFNQVATAFGGCGSDFEVLSGPTPGMAVFTYAAMQHFKPGSEFSEEVLKYLALLMIHDGIYCPPPTIKKDVLELMKWNTSKETQLLWSDIYSRYNEWVAKDLDDIIPQETITDIQAYRLVVCEKSAKAYLNEF